MVSDSRHFEKCFVHVCSRCQSHCKPQRHSGAEGIVMPFTDSWTECTSACRDPVQCLQILE